MAVNAVRSLKSLPIQPTGIQNIFILQQSTLLVTFHLSACVLIINNMLNYVMMLPVKNVFNL